MKRLQQTLKQFEESLDKELTHLEESITATKKDIRESVESYMTFVNEKESYKEFFQAKLDKYGVNAPDELDDDKKKKFFDEVEKEWTGEKDESVIAAGMQEAIAAKFISDEPTEEMDDADKDAGTSDDVKDAEKAVKKELEEAKDEESDEEDEEVKEEKKSDDEDEEVKEELEPELEDDPTGEEASPEKPKVDDQTDVTVKEQPLDIEKKAGK